MTERAGVSRVRRSHVLIGLAFTSGAMSVLLAVAVNVATGGTLPGRLAPYAGWAWPAVGVLAVATVALAFWQQHLQERPPAPRPGAVPAELPEQSALFAGRDRELSALRASVAGGARLVAIAGAAGVGKTSLALRLARMLRPGYPDGQLYARLRGATAEPAEPAAVLTRFLAALGATGAELTGDVETLSARFRTRLAGRRVLILLDDAAGEAQVRPLLSGADRCLTIVTSRPVLAGLGADSLYDLDVMAEREAHDLFAGLVGAQRVEAEPAATAELLGSCGYLPLAVAIAGGRLRARPAWSIGDLAARLADERHRLDELRIGHTEIRASFATSYAELAEPDRLLFRRLGLFPGAEVPTGAATALAGPALARPAAEAGPGGSGAASEAAGAEPAAGVGGAAGDAAGVGAAAEAREVRASLERLVDARLAEVVGVDRYWRHDLVRLFAAERMAEEETPAERDAAFARLVAWYAEAPQPGDLDVVTTLIRRAVADGKGALAWRLIDVLTPLPRIHTGAAAGPLWRDVPVWTFLLDAAPTEDRRAWARLRLGRAYEYDGYLEPALDHLAAARDSLTNPRYRAEAHMSMGGALRNAGRYAEALDEFQKALTLYAGDDEHAGDDEETADVLDGLGTLHITRHEPAEARTYLERAMDIRRAPGSDPGRAAWTGLLLGIVAMQERRFTPARRSIQRAVAAFRQIGDPAGEAYAIRELGFLATNQGRHAEAVHQFERAEALFAEIRLPVGIGMAQDGRGDAHLGAGARTDAAAAYEASAETFRALGDRHREGLSLLKLAEARGGDPEVRERAERLLDGLDIPEADAIRRRLDAGTRLGW